MLIPYILRAIKNLPPDGQEVAHQTGLPPDALRNDDDLESHD
jgi:hypothetical protein